jgi:hypothetical protein
MSVNELKVLLDQVADTRELVLRRSAIQGHPRGAEYDAWSDAHVEAEDAYWRWKRDGGAAHYATYRAAQDREDAAQEALAHSQTSRSSVS